MKITIVTAIHNRANTIGSALESLRTQTHTDVEHIIQDGGSTDETLAVIAQHSDHRTKLESIKDGGIYEALNRGISRATGDVIGMLHSDDVLANTEVLSRVATCFEDSSVQGVYGDLEYVAKDDPSRVLRYWKSGNYHPARLRRGWMPPHPTLFLRRTVYKDYGVYDTSFRISADYEAMLRWFKHANLKFAYLPEVMVKMRVGGKSNRSLSNMLFKSREDLRAIRRHHIGGIGVLISKNLTKVPQFIKRNHEDRSTN